MPDSAAYRRRVLHLRLISPPDRTPGTRALLADHPGVTDVVVLLNLLGLVLAGTLTLLLQQHGRRRRTRGDDPRRARHPHRGRR